MFDQMDRQIDLLCFTHFTFILRTCRSNLFMGLIIFNVFCSLQSLKYEDLLEYHMTNLSDVMFKYTEKYVSSRILFNLSAITFIDI